MNEKIIVPISNGLQVIPMSEILFFEASGAYTKLFRITHNPELISVPLGKFEKQLSPNGFLRIHDHYIINLEHVIGFLNEDGGILLLSTKRKIPISRRKKKTVLEALKKHNLQIT